MTQHQETRCFPKVHVSWQHLLSSLNLKHPIHPQDPVAPPYSEFLSIDSNSRIRVIHVKPDDCDAKERNGRIIKLNGTKLDAYHSGGSKRSSLSEEYWFTKWNKPLKICNCSFRRSLLSNHSLTIPKFREEEETRDSILSYDVPPTKIVNVETFIERIIQETFFEAFQECYMLKKGAHVIPAFDKGEPVVLRKKTAPSRPVNHKCMHKKNHGNSRRPLIMLFHGIGNSADVWWLIINSLVRKGYEVVAPDMLGHGYSSAPNKASCYTFEALLIHAVNIFDHYLGPDDKNKCILIGHSYGTSIVSALYRHRSSQITQLVLLSGGGPTPLAAPVHHNEISPFGCIHTLFKPLLFCGLKRSFLFSSRGKHFDVCDPDNAIPKNVLEHISRGQNWPEGDAAFHRRILVPTLLVHGLQDKQVTLVQQCEMERTVPRAFLELIPNAAHMAMLETPEHLGHMILCFIDTWS